MAEFDLNELFAIKLGYVAPPFILKPQPPFNDEVSPGYNFGAAGANSGQVQANQVILANGVEIRMPVYLQSPGGPKVLLPNEPIVSIKGANEVVVTALNRGGKRGTVKEIINLADYRIRLRGIIYNDTDTYPDTIVRQLRTLFEYPGAIYIDSLSCKLFNISQVAVMDFEFPREEGDPFRYQEYWVEFLSDDNFDLTQIGQ